MIRATAHLSHLLISGKHLEEVAEYGALLSQGFSQVTLAESPAPLARFAQATSDAGLLSVVLWRQGDDESHSSQPDCLLIVSIDGTYPAEVSDSAMRILASDGAAVLQATITLLTARGATGVQP